MQNNHSNGSCASVTRGFIALCAVLAMGVGLMASPAEAAPFAYVTNSLSNTVSVIDTATNTVLATITKPGPSSQFPAGVAVTPDGTKAYVTCCGGELSVIDTANNTVLATILLGGLGVGIAVTPDGKHAYVAINSSTTVSVVDTATNKVVATVPVGFNPSGSPSRRMGNTPM
jgi:YVTN family beta-propeller protein